MIFYTPMQLELVIDGIERQNPKNTVVRGNSIIIVEDDENGGKIIRLISTDPQDYLKPELMPGTKFRG